jgi:transcriptional regulator with XRE-family HTH domain
MPMVPVRFDGGGEVESLQARLAREVREERAARGWRQRDLAREAGVCRATVARIEAGEGGTVMVIDAVCRALGVTFPLGG